MADTTVIHNTFVLERTYPQPPAVVFAAFSDPGCKRRWFAEGPGRTILEYASDFRVGGIEIIRSRFNPGTQFEGVEMMSDTRIEDIVPDRRIVSSSTMWFAGRRISAALATIELLPSERGTELLFTHQAAFFEGADGPEMREMGWRKLFDSLTAELAR